MGKAVPSTPQVYAWALLMLLGPGDGRGGLPRVREWVNVVLEQRVLHEQVLGAAPHRPRVCVLRPHAVQCLR